HLDINYALTDAQKAALTAEMGKLEGLVAELATHEGAYRSFVDGGLIDIRARQRVADFLCDQAERQADAQLKVHRDDIKRVFPDGVRTIFSGQALSRVLNAGREATVALAERAALKIRQLPPTVPGTAE